MQRVERAGAITLGESNMATRTTGSLLLGSTALFTVALAAAVTLIPVDGVRPIVGTAQAQGVAINVQFRSALEPHGRWQQHQRWGEIWIPAKRARDWRPYTEGRWAYTDEWGWYWVSDEDFGWVTYHYGRWVLDGQYGWIWVPGNEWGPAWVQWRRGDRHAGWAPLPPQQVIYDYDDNPDYWVFVSFNNFSAPNIRRVVVPQRERVIYIRETVVVNRTIIVDRGPRIAVNPGIEPRIVAARMGRPIRVANVKPVVVAGTVGVENSVEIRADRRDGRRERVRAEISEKKETIAAAKDVPPPQALKKGEEGRLGDRPPAAAKGATIVQPDAAKGTQPDTAKGTQPDTAKGTQPDTAKGKQDDLAKSKAKDDTTRTKDATKTESGARDAKSKTDDMKGEPKSTKSDDAKGQPKSTKSDDTKGEPKSQAKDATKTDPAAGAKAKTDDAKGGAKSQAKDFGDKAKQPSAVGKGSEPETKAAPKSETRRSEPDKQSVMPKAEPKQAEPKQPAAAPKAADTPRAAPADSGPKGGAAKQDAPKGPPAKAKDEEKGKGG
jgi:hypothetical protein